MKQTKRIVSLILIFLLSISGTVMAAEPKTADEPKNATASASVTDQRQEDLNYLYQTLREKHPDMFAVTEEPVFLKKKAEIERDIAQYSDFQFAVQMQSLVTLIGDSHTTTSLSSAISDYHMYPASLQYFDGQWVLSVIDEPNASFLGKNVTAVNGKTMEEAVSAFEPLLSSDNEVKLRRQFAQVWYVEEMLAAAGITEAGSDITLTVSDASGKTSELTLSPVSREQMKTMELSRLSSLRSAVPATEPDKSTYYKFENLGADTLYIQYNSCQQDPKLPMETFYQQIEDELTKSPKKQVIFDLRNNGGGSDGVLIPLIVLANRLQEEGVRVFCLIGETTFSSAIINSVELKEAGAILVGDPTSGSVDHFGAVASFQLPNSKIKVGYSTKYIELDSLLAEAAKYGVEPLEPDVLSPQTLSDYLNGVDTAVDHILKNGASIHSSREQDEPLTRGLFVGMLAGSLGREIPSVNDGSLEEIRLERFPDVFKFAWYAAAVDWAGREGIVSGTPSGAFEPSRSITREEMAVLFDRFIRTQKLSPENAGETTPFTDLSSISPWAREAVINMQKAGILKGRADGSFDPKGTAVYSEAEIMIRQLFPED